jgi:hypothetical protein
VITGVLLGLLLGGTFDAGATLGVVAPFGSLEYNQQGGISGSVYAGYNHSRSHLEAGAELTSLPGSQQAAYSLENLRVSAGYHHAFLSKVDWQLRGGIGLDWNRLTRRLGSDTERGSVFGSSLTFSYIRSFGHPKFLFQLYGSELVDAGRGGANDGVSGATLFGARLGVGYEF